MGIRSRKGLGLLLTTLLLAGVCQDARAQIAYVNDDAAPGGNGSSWTQAFRDLQDALDAAARSGRSITQVWVAEGTYKPDRGTGDRAATFSLNTGIALYGGFAGGETSVNARPSPLRASILSGEIGNLSLTSDNSLHVVTKRAMSTPATLDGFVIRDGNANASVYPDAFGAGLINEGPMTVRRCTFEANLGDTAAGLSSRIGSIQIQDCVFRNNSTTRDGAGAEVRDSGTIRSSLFAGNSATFGGALNLSGGIRVDSCTFISNFANTGGALRSTSGAAVISRCVFQNNAAATAGAVYLSGGATVTHCLFLANSAGEGGGVACVGAANILSCEFDRNFASASGGAVNINAGVNTVWIRNCTLVRNFAGTVCGGVNLAQGNAVLTNTILWLNADGSANPPQDDQIRGITTAFTVRNCIVQAWSGTLGGMNNRAIDPLFVDADGPDNIQGTLDDDLRLGALSPAIESGSNADAPLDTADLDADGVTTEPAPVDLSGALRFTDPDPPSPPQTDGRKPIDLGAREFQPPPILPGDATRDGNVTFADLTAVLLNWGMTWVPADVDMDGVVDFGDITTVLVHFGNVLRTDM